jgi:hypothetical protein
MSSMIFDRTTAVSAVLLLAACAAAPIEWEPPREIAGTIEATTRLVMEQGGPRLVDQPQPIVTLPAAACSTSVVAARAHGETWYAAWFLVRFDSSVVLMVNRSSDGGSTWSTPVVADGRDRGQRGCTRPRPAVAADSATAYVHVAYFIEPIEGAGVWYTHSMEQGKVWHQTIGVLYGDEPVTASVVSAGDTVLVAYEHPGSRGSRLGVAISRQAGHTFAERLRVVRVSGMAREPRIAFAAGRVGLAWLEQSRTGGAPAVTRTRAQVGALR